MMDYPHAEREREGGREKEGEGKGEYKDNTFEFTRPSVPNGALASSLFTTLPTVQEILDVENIRKTRKARKSYHKTQPTEMAPQSE